MPNTHIGFGEYSGCTVCKRPGLFFKTWDGTDDCVMGDKRYAREYGLKEGDSICHRCYGIISDCYHNDGEFFDADNGGWKKFDGTFTNKNLSKTS